MDTFVVEPHYDPRSASPGSAVHLAGLHGGLGIFIGLTVVYGKDPDSDAYGYRVTGAILEGNEAELLGEAQAWGRRLMEEKIFPMLNPWLNDPLAKPIAEELLLEKLVDLDLGELLRARLHDQELSQQIARTHGVRSRM